MGYYTRFDLDVTPHDLSVIDSFRKSYEYAEWLLGEDGRGTDRGKWYEHEDDLVEFSTTYPETLFTLTGEGEEAGDLWKLYVRNGVSQTAEAVITYAPPTV